MLTDVLRSLLISNTSLNRRVQGVSCLETLDVAKAPSKGGLLQGLENCVLVMSSRMLLGVGGAGRPNSRTLASSMSLGEAKT